MINEGNDQLSQGNHILLRVTLSSGLLGFPTSFTTTTTTPTTSETGLRRPPGLQALEQSFLGGVRDPGRF